MDDLESEAIRVHRDLLNAWNARDAGSVAACFCEDGNLVGFDGSTVNSRRGIEQYLRPVFADHPTARFIAIVREVRRLGPDAALLRAVAGMVPPGTAAINPALNAIQSLVVSSREGPWRAELFHNTPAAFHRRPDLARQLTAELQDLAARHAGA